MSKVSMIKDIDRYDDKIMDLTLEFWRSFGHFGTWQFWANVFFFVIPLALTLIFIDRKRIFQISFFGYTYHMFLVYLDIYFTRNNIWDHPYHLIPYVPVSIPVDGVLVPIIFMAAYQYSIRHNRNFYLVTLLFAVVGTLTAAGWEQFGLLILYKGMNLFHIYILQISLAILAYWGTNAFLYLQSRGKDINPI